MGLVRRSDIFTSTKTGEGPNLDSENAEFFGDSVGTEPPIGSRTAPSCPSRGSGGPARRPDESRGRDDADSDWNSVGNCSGVRGPYSRARRLCMCDRS